MIHTCFEAKVVGCKVGPNEPFVFLRPTADRLHILYNGKPVLATAIGAITDRCELLAEFFCNCLAGLADGLQTTEVF